MDKSSSAMSSVLQQFSRRGFLRRAGLAAAVFAGIWLGAAGVTMPVAYASFSCNYCFSACDSCGICVGFLGECRSPNGTSCSGCCGCAKWEREGLLCTPAVFQVVVGCCDNTADSYAVCQGC